MKQFVCLFLLSIWSLSAIDAQDIYHNGNSLITGTWNANGTLVETGADQPFEGDMHYRFDYAYTEYWCGFGLNMDNWGTGAPVDFSAYTHIRLAYRGLEAGQTLRLQLRLGDEYGALYEMGGQTMGYQELEIPLILLQGGLNLATITGLDFSVNGDVPEGSGNLFLDAIYLVNNGGTAIGSQSWGLLQAMDKGFNLTNWLEAYWLIPFNAFPETEKFTRDHIAFMADAGMKTIRMPATFERVAGPAPDYALDLTHEIFDLVDSVILWAADYNMVLIIDNHHGFELNNSNFNSELPRMKAIWNQLLDLYGHLDPNTTLFELYNEATPAISNNNLKLFYDELVSELRNTTTQHTFILGANGWNSGDALMAFSPLDDQRIIYTFHSYDPYLFTHQGMSWTSPPFFEPRTFPLGNEENDIRALFQGVSSWSDIYDIPVFLGEFGCAVSADEQSRCNYIELLTHLSDSLDMPYVYWDVFQPTDGFGFVEDEVLEPDNVVLCFMNAMELNFGVLSTSIVGFKTDCKDENLQLQWKISDSDRQVQEQRFELEYSERGMHWLPVPTESTLAESQMISFTIPARYGPYFRLKEWNPDGTYQYSGIQHSSCEPANHLQVFPNPASDRLYFSAENFHVDGEIKILDMSGRTLLSHPVSFSGLQTIPLPEVPEGIHLLVFERHGNRLPGVQRIVILEGTR